MTYVRSSRARASLALGGALTASLSLAACGSCGSSPGVADKDLGNLVIAPKKKADAINVAKAAKDPAELTHALARPYRDTVAAIGAHTYNLATSTTVDEAGKRVDELSDNTTIEIGDKGAYHAIYTNTSDYGREVIFADKMYLRPRYQRWHGRAPETPDEPAAVRDSFFEAIFATWDLLAPAAELTDAGTVQHAGKTGRKIVIKLSPSPRSPAAETLVQRKWREKRNVEAVAGEVILDAETGVPLSAKIQGIVSFTRDGRRFSMKLNVDAAASAIGTVVPIAPPEATEVVATPERLREVDDRDFLLQGIAPPSRRNPDGSPVPPSPKAFEGKEMPTPAQAPAAGSDAGSASPDEEPKKKRKKKFDDESTDESKSDEPKSDAKP